MPQRGPSHDALPSATAVVRIWHAIRVRHSAASADAHAVGSSVNSVLVPGCASGEPAWRLKIAAGVMRLAERQPKSVDAAWENRLESESFPIREVKWLRIPRTPICGNARSDDADELLECGCVVSSDEDEIEPADEQVESSEVQDADPGVAELARGPDPISERISAAFDEVPDIGARWNRWYDGPYKVLWFLQTKWRRKIIPDPMLRAFHRWARGLAQFNELERDRIWDPTDRMHDFEVPSEEHVVMPGMWVVELFPPSAFARLEQAIRRNGWDRDRWRSGAEDTNVNMLLKSRARMGWRWWRMASIQDVNGTYLFPDGVRAKLPPEFSFVELKAMQIGSGLTAVVAHIQLSALGSKQLDETWHRTHEPKLIRRDGRLQALDRMWSGFHVTQRARARLHELARAWMKDNCDGFFAEFDNPQTLIDMLVLDQHDPTDHSDESDRDLFDAFRALGITEIGVENYVSSDIPKMHLVPTRPSMARGMTTDRSWALWGQRQAVMDNAKNMNGYGDDPNRAIAHRYGRAIESFLVPLALSDMLETVEARYALIRDRARSQHGRFKAKVINDLREQLLTLSIDVATLQRDLDRSWKSRPQFQDEAEFTIEYSPRFRRDADEDEPFHVNTELRKRQKEWFEELTAADRDYRDILATVASLGGSVDASMTGRRALWVAFVSLAVACATVVVTDVGDDSLFHQLGKFLHGRF
jgi:hypothetical protein